MSCGTKMDSGCLVNTFTHYGINMKLTIEIDNDTVDEIFLERLKSDLELLKKEIIPIFSLEPEIEAQHIGALKGAYKQILSYYGETV
jgi:hypothetical protein